MAVEFDGHTLVTWWLARKQRGQAGPREGITFKSPPLVIYFLKAKQAPQAGFSHQLGNKCSKYEPVKDIHSQIIAMCLIPCLQLSWPTNSLSISSS